MVDIHIRDVSNLDKRKAVVRELVEKHGRKGLIFEIQPPSNFSYYGHCYKLLLFGDYRGSLSRLDMGFGGAPFGASPRADEHLLWITSYRVWKSSSTSDAKNGWERDEASQRLGSYVVGRTFEAGEDRGWWVVVTTADLINIYTPTSVEPVVVKKEIEA